MNKIYIIQHVSNEIFDPKLSKNPQVKPHPKIKDTKYFFSDSCDWFYHGHLLCQQKKSEAGGATNPRVGTRR